MCVEGRVAACGFFPSNKRGERDGAFRDVHAHHGLHRALNLLGHLCCRHKGDLGPGVVNLSGSLLSAKGRKHGRVDQAQREAGEIHHRPFPTVFGEQRDAVALLHAL